MPGLGKRELDGLFTKHNPLLQFHDRFRPFYLLLRHVDGQIMTISPLTGNSTQYYVYCSTQPDGSLLMRTLRISPIDQFGFETRLRILQTNTGFTMIVNPSGDCLYPNNTGVLNAGYFSYTVSSPESKSLSPFYLSAFKSNKLVPILVGSIVGGVGFVLLIIVIVVVVFFVVRKKDPQHSEMLRPTTTHGTPVNYVSNCIRYC